MNNYSPSHAQLTLEVECFVQSWVKRKKKGKKKINRAERHHSLSNCNINLTEVKLLSL